MYTDSPPPESVSPPLERTRTPLHSAVFGCTLIPRGHAVLGILSSNPHSRRDPRTRIPAPMSVSSHCRLKQIQEQAARQKGMSKGQKRRLAELEGEMRRAAEARCSRDTAEIQPRYRRGEIAAAEAMSTTRPRHVRGMSRRRTATRLTRRRRGG